MNWTETRTKLIEYGIDDSISKEWKMHIDLHGAYLHGAYLSGADLYGANLIGAYLHGANLSDANLHGAYLSGAYLRDADLRDANYDYRSIGFCLACPEVGAFDAWKKLRGGKIAHLRIPSKSRRSSATTRKCRAERVKVVQIYSADGEMTYDVGESMRDLNFMYRVGEYIDCHEWDDNRWDECSGGIHFFLTRAEAEAWNG